MSHGASRAVSAGQRIEDLLKMSWTSDQARSLADKILSFSKAAECEVSLGLSQDREYAVRRQ